MERDFPVGHPAASDYKGEPYFPQTAPFGQDFPKGHRARGGANISALDTPDGSRAAFNKQSQDLQALAAMGSLPPLRDPETGKDIELTAPELAYIYAVRKGLPAVLADQVTDRYNLEPMPKAADADEKPVITAEHQAELILIGRGFSPERAKVLIEKYGVPDTLQEFESDAHR